MDANDLDTIPPNFFAGYFDRNNPLSLYSKLGAHWSKKFIDKLSELPEAAVMLHDETMLKKWLKEKRFFKPTATDNKYRYQLWLEYENSVNEQRLMEMARVYHFVGAEAVFYQLICVDANRMVWLMCRPSGYEATAREMLLFGMQQMRRYLEEDPFENPHKPNMKLMEMQFKITQMMDLRMHGAPTQKIQQLNISAAMGANGDLKAIVEKGDMKSLQAKLEDLRARKRKAEGRGMEALPEGELAPEPGDEAPILEAELVPAVKRDG